LVRIVFNRGVEDCNFVASVGRPDGLTNANGIATAWWDSGEDAVLAITSNFDGSRADHPVQVIVFCAGWARTLAKGGSEKIIL
jgi:hypothetical protein